MQKGAVTSEYRPRKVALRYVRSTVRRLVAFVHLSEAEERCELDHEA